MKKHLLVLLPWFCMCVGEALNILVMSANHGMMPVYYPLNWAMGYAPGAATDMVHVTWSSTVHLSFLADWIMVKRLAMIVSPGDLFLYFGGWCSPYCIGAWLALVWSERKKPILTQAYDGVLYDRAVRTAQPEPRLRLQ